LDGLALAGPVAPATRQWRFGWQVASRHCLAAPELQLGLALLRLVLLGLLHACLSTRPVSGAGV
jgi:hypothetical protein